MAAASPAVEELPLLAAAGAAPAERRAAEALFRAAAEQPQRVRNSLIELAKDYPQETMGFLERGLLLSALAGLFVGVPCLVQLLPKWEECGVGERPLRMWILVAGILHVAQCPLRLQCLRRLAVGQKAAGSAVSAAAAVLAGNEMDRVLGSLMMFAVMDVVQSRMWRASQAVSCLSLAWIIIGVVWVSNCTPSQQCPEAYYTTIKVLATALVRLLYSVMSFRMTFTSDTDSEQLDTVEPPPEPIPAANLEAIPLIRCPLTHSTKSSGKVCAICLCGFRHRQALRLLPCKHFFHQRCIDQWLTQRSLCPLCRSEDLVWSPSDRGPARLP